MNIPTYVSIQVAFFISAYLIVIATGSLLRTTVKTPTTTKGRYAHLDGLRALAAIGVVACHTNQHLLAFFGIAEVPEYGNRIGIISVQMFFALTSFLFTSRALDVGLDSAKFYIGRVRRIVPLYVFVALCTVVLGIFMAAKPVDDLGALVVNVIDIFAYGFIGSAPLTILDFNAERLIGIAWTLSFEWKFYVVFPVLFLLATSSKKLGLLIAFILAALAARDYYLIGEVIWPFFVVGSLAAFLKKNIPAIPGYLKSALNPLSILLLIVAIAVPGYFSAGHLLIATALFIVVLYGEPALLKGNALRVIGTISYSYYLLQYLVLAPIVLIAWHMDIAAASPYWKFATALLIPILLVPISCLTYRLIEQPWMHAKTSKAPAVYGAEPAKDEGLQIKRSVPAADLVR